MKNLANIVNDEATLGELKSLIGQRVLMCHGENAYSYGTIDSFSIISGDGMLGGIRICVNGDTEPGECSTSHMKPSDCYQVTDEVVPGDVVMAQLPNEDGDFLTLKVVDAPFQGLVICQKIIQEDRNDWNDDLILCAFNKHTNIWDRLEWFKYNQMPIARAKAANRIIQRSF